jgi:hypothetical protein
MPKRVKKIVGASAIPPQIHRRFTISERIEFSAQIKFQKADNFQHKNPPSIFTVIQDTFTIMPLTRACFS